MLYSGRAWTPLLVAMYVCMIGPLAGPIDWDWCFKVWGSNLGSGRRRRCSEEEEEEESGGQLVDYGVPICPDKAIF